jgi:peptidoglycan/xylan/chitin deacetylase (PgdA/CDA1 family)
MRSSTTAGDRGTCVISIDTELAWGVVHRRGGSQARHRFAQEREVIDAVLALFARDEIPATWAVVGHLFLDACEDDGRGPHSELVTPDYEWLEGAWLANDPCSTLEAEPNWYGRDIVDAIRACPVRQEIGSHSFTHVIVDDPACTPEVFASELHASRRAAAACGVTLRSFVYPRNRIGLVPLLAEHGFRCYRGSRAVPPFADRSGWQRRALVAIDRLRPLAGSAVTPAREPSGVWNVPQTYLFAPVESRRHLPPAVWSRRPVARLRQAARTGSLFHMWFHPSNLTGDPERALAALEHICRAAARLRDAGELSVVTMGDLAARLDDAAGRPPLVPPPSGTGS